MMTSTKQLQVKTAEGNAAHLQRLMQIEEAKKSKEEREREEQMYQALKKWIMGW